MAKEFALDQCRRDGSTIDDDQRPFMPATGGMNSPRNQFLAGSGFTQDKNRRVRRCHLGDVAKYLLKSLALANQRPVWMQGLQFLAEQFGFYRQRLDFLLSFHSIMDVAQDQRGKFLPMQFKPRQGRLGGE